DDGDVGAIRTASAADADILLQVHALHPQAGDGEGGEQQQPERDGDAQRPQDDGPCPAARRAREVRRCDGGSSGSLGCASADRPPRLSVRKVRIGGKGGEKEKEEGVFAVAAGRGVASGNRSDGPGAMITEIPCLKNRAVPD